ncbi:MAG: hypothetical protein H6585_11675 [Flavobacteriales bacterium]|nr:hypothetical protein [Flavobacteriales bacterium]MCB9448989.1 hypothetical protein [Flavobacteriales bacterium]
MRLHTYLRFVCIAICFAACRSSNKDLEGTWLAAYKINDGDSAIEHIGPFILDFMGDKVGIKSLMIPAGYEVDTTTEWSAFSRLGNEILIGSDSDTTRFSIQSLDQTYLKVRIPRMENAMCVFMKLPVSVSPLVGDLSGRAFAITNQRDGKNGMVDFLPNQKAISLYDSEDGIDVLDWGIQSFRQYQLITINFMMQSAWLLTSMPNGTLVMIQYDGKILLSEINERKDTTGLCGNWVNHSEDSIPLPPMPNGEPLDQSQYLRIAEDSLSIVQYGKPKTFAWRLSSTGEYIYFPDRMVAHDGVWKIVELGPDHLTVRCAVYPASGGYEWQNITYGR